MNHDQPTPEQLLQQLVEESAALCEADLKLKEADLKLKAAQQRGDELLRGFQVQMDANRRVERWATVILFAIATIAGLVAHLLYPKWLPDHLATVSSFLQHL